MNRYEYKVVPAPKRGEKVRGARHVEDRFAHALMTLMNRMGRDGWEYQRADTLPCEERSGLTGRSTTYQNMLVFRRVVLPEPAIAPDTTDEAAEADETVEADLLPASEPLSEAAEAKLASIHPIQMPARGEGPRLVSPARDQGGPAPALGPAARGGDRTGDTPAE